MLSGVLFGVAACLIWGTVYIGPLLLTEYSPALIALARFFVFGGLSALLAFRQWHELRQYTRSDWKRATALGLIGNIMFYWTLAEAVQRAGAPIAGAFTAMIPILVALIGNQRAKTNGHAVPWRRLCLPLLLVFVGMACLNGTEFVYLVGSGHVSSTNFWIGVLFAVIALLIWTWYPLSNAEWLIEHPKNSPQAWSTAQGLTLLPCSAVGLVIWMSLTPPETLFAPHPMLFIGVALFLGIIGSWVGILFWNMMSQRLPPALSGQMIIFETIFAVIYAHIYRAELPTPLMTLGMILLLLGILGSLRVFRSPA